jgi:DNA invertase Pin-like site-specific DNA recombinase
MRAVIYARVSTSRQEEAGTIETQLDYILHDPVVAARFELLTDKYLDNGVSGHSKPLWERPQGKRLLADAKAVGREFDAIVVYKFNRLGRKMIDTEQAIKEITDCGVLIYDVKNHLGIDNKTATGILIRQMMGIVAEFERNNDVETIRDGMERLAREKRWLPTHARLGYDWSRVESEGGKKGHKVKGAALVVNQKESQLVQLIFDMFERVAQNHLTKWLNENGYRLPCKVPGLQEKYGRSERLFTARDIGTIVSDSLYTGMVEWGKTTKMAGRTPTPYSHYVSELQIISIVTMCLNCRLSALSSSIESKELKCSVLKFRGSLLGAHISTQDCCGAQSVVGLLLVNVRGTQTAKEQSATNVGLTIYMAGLHV